MGISRSATIILAYLIWKGMEYDSALAILKEKRPRVNPNEGFTKALINYELSLKESKKEIID